MSEMQSEAAIIEALSNIIPDDGYNIGQAEENTEANPKQGAETETKQQAEQEVKEPAKQEPEENNKAEQAEVKQEPQEVEIEIDGNLYKIPAELKANIMMEKDYRQKTMALSEERKQLEAEKGKIPQDVQQKLAQYEQLLADAVEQDKAINWQELLHKDPIGYLQKKEIAAARAAELQRVQAEQKQQYDAWRSQVETKEMAQLIAKRPDLKDTAAFEAYDKKQKSFLKHEGYGDKEIESAFMDHRVRLLVEDAIKYRELEKAKVETAKKIEKLPPKVERPGVPSGTDSQGAKSAMSKLKQSGKLDDAAEALRALMG